MFDLFIRLHSIAGEDQDGSFSNPSYIEMEVKDECGNTVKPVLSAKWDAALLMNWLRENEPSILSEPYPFEMRCGESIAEAISRFYKEVDPEDDLALDNAYSCREKHGLRLALRGLDVPDVT